MVIASIIALAVLAALTVFQILLMLGKPLGDFAWGGQHKVLPRNLRIGSATSIVLYIIFAAFLVSKAEILPAIPNTAVVGIGIWIITGYFFLGIILNGISRNKKERSLMTPVVSLLALCFLFVALG